MNKSFSKFPILILILVFIFNLNILAGDIVIAVQPQAVNLCKGSSAKLMVDAFSQTKQNLYYQWLKDGIKLNGETTAVLNIDNAVFELSGVYSCRLTNADSSDMISSRSAAVYVLSQTTITEEPQDVALAPENSSNTVKLAFRAHVNGIPIEDMAQKGENFDIQWYRINVTDNEKISDGKDFVGVKTNNLSINLADLPDTTRYFAVISGKCGTATTRTATVIKNSRIIVWTFSSKPVFDCSGTEQSITAEISSSLDTNLISYRWYKDGKPLFTAGNLTGVYTNKLVFNPLMQSDGGKYYLEASIKSLNYVRNSPEIEVIPKVMPKVISFFIDTATVMNSKNNGSYTMYNLNLTLGNINEKSQINFYKDGNLLVIEDGILDNISSYAHYMFLQGDSVVPYIRDSNSKFWAIISNDCGWESTDTIDFKTQKLPDILFAYLAGKDQRDHLFYDTSFYNNTYYRNNLCYFIACKNSSVNLDCIAREHSSLNLKAVHQWYRGDWISVKPPDTLSGYSYSNFYIKKLTPNDTDYYYDVISFVGTNFVLATKPIKVSIAPGPVITGGSGDVAMVEGDSSTVLSGSTLDYPLPHDTIFIKIYFMSTKNSTPIIIDSLMTGSIDWQYDKTVSLSDQGYYFAKISNSCGSVITDTIYLKVIPKTITRVDESSSGNENFVLDKPYPSPATNEVHIRIYAKDLTELIPGKVVIYNSFGEKLVNTDIRFIIKSNTSSELSWNCSNITPGVYFLNLSLDGEMKSVPVVVTK